MLPPQACNRFCAAAFQYFSDADAMARIEAEKAHMRPQAFKTDSGLKQLEAMERDNLYALTICHITN